MEWNSMYDSQPSNANYLLPTAYRCCLLYSVFCACIKLWYKREYTQKSNLFSVLFKLQNSLCMNFICGEFEYMRYYLNNFKSFKENSLLAKLSKQFFDYLIIQWYLLPWNRYVMDRESPICHVFKT